MKDWDIIELENILVAKIKELSAISFCHTSVPKLSEDVKLITESIRVLKLPNETFKKEK